MRKTFGLSLAGLLLLALPVWASTMKSIGKDQVNVRANPSLKSDVLFQAYLGYPIEVEKQQDDWVYFHDWRDNTGWIYKPLVSKVQTAVVTVDNANVRKGPSLGRPVVMQVKKGEIYKIFAEQGNWVKIGYYLENEEIGWIRQDLVWGD